MGHRQELVSQPESRVQARPVGAREVGKGLEPEVDPVPQVGQRLQQLLGGDGDRDFPSSLEHLGEALTKAFGQFGGDHPRNLASLCTLS